MVDPAFSSLLRHLENIANGEESASYSESEVKYAVVTLLCRVIIADGVVLPAEIEGLKKHMADNFGDEEVNWQPILDNMQNRNANTDPVFATTAILLEAFDHHERQKVVNMMIDIAVSDGEIVEPERILISKVAEMLKVETNLGMIN